MLSCVAPHLGEMLDGSAHPTSVSLDVGHVSVDGAGVPWLPALRQQAQRDLTLAQCILGSVLCLVDASQRGKDMEGVDRQAVSGRKADGHQCRAVDET